MDKKNLKIYEVDRFRRFDRTTQVISLSLLAAVVIISWVNSNQTGFYAVLTLVGGFSLLWYRFFPSSSYNLKVLVEYLVIVFLVSVLVKYTGGINSFFNFFYYIVIFGAIARTTFNNTMVIAGTVSLAIITQTLIFFGTPDFPLALKQAAVLLFNQILVTLIAIYLIREIESNSKKYYEEMAEMEKIKEQDRLKDEFVFIASHELRAPITTMKGYLELLLHDYGDKMNGEMIRTLKVVFHDADHLSQMVEDMLNVARIEAGKFKYSPKVFSLTTLVNKVVDGMEPKAKTKKISLTWEGRKEYKINAEEGKVEEVLDNLIDNAIKYTPEFGKIEVTMKEEDGKAIVHIKDNGLGIPEDFKKHIFEKFSRVERTQPGMTGTGLGLFIVKQLVLRMGGAIWFESTEGKGSTFSFSFPKAN